jgi:hypothetical protein
VQPRSPRRRSRSCARGPNREERLRPSRLRGRRRTQGAPRRLPAGGRPRRRLSCVCS